MKRMALIAGAFLLGVCLLGTVVWWSSRFRTEPHQATPKAAAAPIEDVKPVPPPRFPDLVGNCGTLMELSGPGGRQLLPIRDPRGPDRFILGAPKEFPTRELLAWLKDKTTSPDRRFTSLRTLAERRDEAPQIIPVLIETLLDPEVRNDTELCKTIIALGQKETTGHFTIDKVLAQERVQLRLWLAFHIERAGSVARGLAVALKSPIPELRSKAVSLLTLIGDDARDVLPELRRLCENSDDANLRAETLQLITSLDAMAALPELLRAIKGPDPLLRGRAAVALGRMGKPAVAPLRDILKETDRDIRGAAIAALGRIGPDAKDAVPDLLALLKQEEELTRKLAGDALRKIDPQSADAAGIK